MLNSVIDTCIAPGYTKFKHVKSLHSVNNILSSFNKLVKILPQNTEMEQNRERLVEEIQHC